MPWVDAVSRIFNDLAARTAADVSTTTVGLSASELQLLDNLVQDQIRHEIKHEALPHLLGSIKEAVEQESMLVAHRALVGAVTEIQELNKHHDDIVKQIGGNPAGYKGYMYALMREMWTDAHTEQLAQYVSWTLDDFHPVNNEATQWWWKGASTPVSRCAALIGGCFDGVSAADEEMREAAPNGSDLMMQEFLEMANRMKALGLGMCWRDVVRLVLRKRMCEKIEETCSDVYTEPVFAKLITWIYSPLLVWLRLACGLRPIGPSTNPSADEKEWAKEAKLCVLFFVEKFCDVRVGHTLEMVKDFPDSRDALIDLKIGLAHVPAGQLTSQHLRSTLREQFAKRLNVAGVETRRVILGYCKIVKAMQILDPRGATLEAVSKPINEYLHGRPDTVRCILSLLTSEGGELQAELQEAQCAERTDENTAVTPFGDFEVSDSESEGDDKWTPEPFELFQDAVAHRKKRTDLIYLLVSIYGSKEKFINEYKEMLSERLFTCRDYDASWEKHNLELLKTRFGENMLMNCDVMLQDVTDSKRINKLIQDEAQQVRASAPTSRQQQRQSGMSVLNFLPRRNSHGPSSATTQPQEMFVDNSFSIPHVQALMLSHAFWPNSLKKEDKYPTMKLPQQLESILQDYSKYYSKIRHTRTLQWKRTRGTVNVRLVLNDRAVEMELTPLQAAIIFCFREENQALSGNPAQKSVSQIAAAVDVHEEIIRKTMLLFVSKGILREVQANVYEVMEEKPTAADIMVEELDLETADLTEEATAEPNAKMRNFICGMLANVPALPIGRIRHLLHMFMTEEDDEPYSQTEAELAEFLTTMCNEGKLKVANGQYSLMRERA